MVHAARAVDPTFYPETDRMGEGELQRMITELLRPLLARFLAEQGIVAHVGANTFLYYEPRDATERIAPDVYVLPGITQHRLSRVWKLWEVPPPSFCLEVVSRDVGKDYEDAPPIHAAIGTGELVIFDPEAKGHRGRIAWQVYRRTRDRFSLEERTNDPYVRSRELRCALRAVGAGDALRLRVATGPRAAVLFPTEPELLERERAEKERERAEKERERAERERERAARVELEAEVAALRDKLRGRKKR